MSSDQNPGWLGYIGDYTTQLYIYIRFIKYMDPYSTTSVSWKVRLLFFFFVAHLTKKLQDIHKKSFGMICLKVAYGENKKNSRCFFGWYWPGSAKTYVNVRTFKAQFQDCLG